MTTAKVPTFSFKVREFPVLSGQKDIICPIATTRVQQGNKMISNSLFLETQAAYEFSIFGQFLTGFANVQRRFDASGRIPQQEIKEKSRQRLPLIDPKTALPRFDSLTVNLVLVSLSGWNILLLPSFLS